MRAKRTLAEARVPFEVPRGRELAERLASVLEVIYLIFNEGYAASAGEDWIRPELCEDALRLGRILAELLPGEAEVHGLVALMEIQASRSRARIGPAGRAGAAARSGPRALGPRPDQPRPRGAAARRAARRRSARTACRPRSPPVTPARAARRTPTGSGSSRSTTRSSQSPRRRSSSSTARSRSRWPTGLRPGSSWSTRSRGEPLLSGYHLLPSVRGELLARLGRDAEARAELERAASLARNGPERELLRERAARLN